jgi:hypothetical protein
MMRSREQMVGVSCDSVLISAGDPRKSPHERPFQRWRGNRWASGRCTGLIAAFAHFGYVSSLTFLVAWQLRATWEAMR